MVFETIIRLFYFDFETGHTLFMSTSRYQKKKKILKALVHHRSCGVCKWWKRQRPGLKVRPHTCVFNHSGSARSIESAAGVQAVAEFHKAGYPIDIIEGDGDSSVEAKLRDAGFKIQKKFDKNHIVKNITTQLYNVAKDRSLKLSKDTISHIEKCLKYALASNKKKPEELRENLLALIPHQFGDHAKCKEDFCLQKRQPDKQYKHQSLPYKHPLSNPVLREKLEKIFQTVASHSVQYSDLGSSQANESANQEVSLRAPKNTYYGDSKALDYRVHASAMYKNEGRGYVSKVFFLNEAKIVPVPVVLVFIVVFSHFQVE